MVQTPTVSVVIPAFNSAGTIQRALDSVLAQQGAEVEVIIVDDGSTDDTLAAIEPYQPGVNVLRQANAGPSAARNLALPQCSGEFVAFLDSDDEWLAGRLAEGLAPALHDPNVVMTFCWAYLRRANGRQSLRNKRSPGHDPQHLLLWPSPMQQTSGTLCRRSVLEEVGGFDTDLSTREDLDLWIRMAERGAVAEVRSPLVITHESTGSYSFAHTIESQRRDYFRVIDKALARAPERYAAVEQRIRAEAHRYWGQFALYHGDLERARVDLARSIDLHARLSTRLLAVLARLPHTVTRPLRRLYGWTRRRAL